MHDPMSVDLSSLRIERSIAPSRGVSSLRRSLRALAVVVVAVLVASGAVVAHQLARSSERRPRVAAPAPSRPAPAVQAGVAFASTGYVVARASAPVGSPIVGRVARVLVEEGDHVEAGQVLVELEDRGARADLATAQARAGAARLHAEEARARYEEARVQATRAQRLAATGAVALSSFEDAEAHRRALESAAAASAADADASETGVAAVRAALRDHVVRAPIAGTVVGDPVHVGTLASPSGGVLVELVDFGSLVVETDLPEARLHAVRVGAPCEVVFDAYPEDRHRCTTIGSGRRVDRAKATVSVRVRLDEPPAYVLPDMAARVSFLSQPPAAGER